MSKKNQQSVRFVAVEMSHQDLRLAVCKREKEGLSLEAVETLQWRDQAKSPFTEAGRAELSIAVRRMVQKYRLNHHEVLITLSGEFCVSRGVTGSTERVRHELGELERRSKLYLSLGHGEKALGMHIRQVDARHQHALVAVVNQRMVDSVLHVFGDCGLEVKILEPSLVSLCRLVGTLELDAEAPVLVAHLTQQGLEIAISHQGYVLLDYRPSKGDDDQTFAGLIGDQLHRLRRYCFRYCRFAEGELKRLYVCGDDAKLVAQAVEDAGQIEGLETEVLRYDSQTRWQNEEDETGMYAACFGLASQRDPSIPASAGPNLLDKAVTLKRIPLRRELIRMAMPLAATLLLAMVAWSWALYTQTHSAAIEQRIAELEHDVASANAIKLQVRRDAERIKYIQTIAKDIPTYPWENFPTLIANCMPDDVWLDSIVSTESGALQLKGGSFQEDSVFEFVGLLGKCPLFERVALSRSNQIYTKTGPALDFMVTCNLAKFAD